MAIQRRRVGVLEILLPAVVAAFFIQLVAGDLDEREIVWRTFLTVPLIVNVTLNWFFPLRSHVSLPNKQVERYVVIGSLFTSFLLILVVPAIGLLVLILALYGFTAWRIGVLLTRRPHKEGVE